MLGYVMLSKWVFTAIFQYVFSLYQLRSAAADAAEWYKIYGATIYAPGPGVTLGPAIDGRFADPNPYLGALFAPNIEFGEYAPAPGFCFCSF